MHLHEKHTREAFSSLMRAQREAEADIHRATCHKRLPDDILGSLTGCRMTETNLENYAALEDLSLTIASRRRRFSFWRRSVKKFPSSF